MFLVTITPVYMYILPLVYYHKYSAPFTCIHLKDDQWKQDAPELNVESHSKGPEYLCKLGDFCFDFVKL
jgi:hypothetical protein